MYITMIRMQSPFPQDVDYENEDLEGMTKAVLKKGLKKYKVKGYSDMTKSEMISALNDAIFNQPDPMEGIGKRLLESAELSKKAEAQPKQAMEVSMANRLAQRVTEVNPVAPKKVKKRINLLPPAPVKKRAALVSLPAGENFAVDPNRDNFFQENVQIGSKGEQSERSALENVINKINKDPNYGRSHVSTLEIEELRAIAKANGLKGSSKMRRDTLVKELSKINEWVETSGVITNKSKRLEPEIWHVMTDKEKMTKEREDKVIEDRRLAKERQNAREDAILDRIQRGIFATHMKNLSKKVNDDGDVGVKEAVKVAKKKAVAEVKRRKSKACHLRGYSKLSKVDLANKVNMPVNTSSRKALHLAARKICGYKVRGGTLNDYESTQSTVVDSDSDGNSAHTFVPNEAAMKARHELDNYETTQSTIVDSEGSSDSEDSFAFSAPKRERELDSHERKAIEDDRLHKLQYGNKSFFDMVMEEAANMERMPIKRSRTKAPMAAAAPHQPMSFFSSMMKDANER